MKKQDENIWTLNSNEKKLLDWIEENIFILFERIFNHLNRNRSFTFTVEPVPWNTYVPDKVVESVRIKTRIRSIIKVPISSAVIGIRSTATKCALSWGKCSIFFFTNGPVTSGEQCHVSPNGHRPGRPISNQQERRTFLHDSGSNSKGNCKHLWR